MKKFRTVVGLRAHTFAALAVAATAIATSIVVFRAGPTPALPASWLEEFGSNGHDSATSAAADASGVVIAGWSTGVFAGQTFAGGPQDAFVVRSDTAGTVDLDPRIRHVRFRCGHRRGDRRGRRGARGRPGRWAAEWIGDRTVRCVRA